jgi:hypothetical protein
LRKSLLIQEKMISTWLPKRTHHMKDLGTKVPRKIEDEPEIWENLIVYILH